VMAVAQQPFAVRLHEAAVDYRALTKPEINFLIAIATFAGFYLGYPAQFHAFPFMLLIHTLLGTLLVSKRRGHTKPVCGAPLRCSDAADEKTAARFR
jgi:heme O synthase-like polyprenyltransferase